MNDYITYTSPIERAMTSIGVIVVVCILDVVGGFIGGLE